MLLVFGCDGVLGLLLHALHKVLHVLEGIDLEKHNTDINGWQTCTCIIVFSLVCVIFFFVGRC